MFIEKIFLNKKNNLSKNLLAIGYPPASALSKLKRSDWRAGWLLATFLFLLPWQTRYIWHYGILNGDYWEYGSYSFYATEILLWLLIAVFIVGALINRRKWGSKRAADFFSERKTILFALCFLFYVLAILPFSLNRELSFNYFFHLLEGVLIFSIILVYPLSKNKMLWALWGGGVLQGFLGTWQFLSQEVVSSKWLGMAAHLGQDLGASVIEFGDQRWLRAYGSFGSPNSLGIYLATVLLLGLILYVKTDNKKYKLCLTAGQLIIFSGLIFSFSRNAWLSALAGGAVLLYFLKNKKQRVSIFKQAVCYLCFLFAMTAVFYPVFSARFNLGNRLEYRSVNERVDQYGEALKIFENNILIGQGLGVHTLALYNLNGGLNAWDYQPVHNVYLLILAETGFLGLSLFLALHSRLIALITRRNAVYLATAFSLLIFAIFDHWTWTMYTGTVFWWIIWGIGVKKP